MFQLSSKLLSLSCTLHIPAEFCDFFSFFSINSLPLCISISSIVRGRFFFIESTSAHLSVRSLFFCRLFDSFEWVFSLFFAASISPVVCCCCATLSFLAHHKPFASERKICCVFVGHVMRALVPILTMQAHSHVENTKKKSKKRRR